MTVWRLVLREISHRKLNFGLGLLSVLVAVACLTGALTLLDLHDLGTERIIAAKEAETRKQMAKLEDDYRKIMKQMGFNVLIVPKDQNLTDLYAENFASKYMPEEYATRLAQSKIVTIQHLLPSLQQKTKWPEQGDRTIIVIGTRGEVPIVHADAKKPILDAVAPGTIVLGHELHRGAKLKPGDQTKLLGREFTVSKCYPERGTKDDVTAWVNLKEAQELFDKRGLINGILALECVCAADSLAKIRAEIGGILPDTHVIEFASQAVARAEARQRAATVARESIEAEKLQRGRLRRAREEFAAWLVPVVMIACGVWIGFLMFGNVRERRAEIGVLRAIGLRSRQILLVFLSRALWMGLLGGVAGYAAGFCVGTGFCEPGVAARLFRPDLLALVLVAAPALAVIASWIPSVLAAQQDPAVVLREE
jgi:hypothetical protein